MGGHCHGRGRALRPVEPHAPPGPNPRAPPVPPTPSPRRSPSRPLAPTIMPIRARHADNSRHARATARPTGTPPSEGPPNDSCGVHNCGVSLPPPAQAPPRDAQRFWPSPRVNTALPARCCRATRAACQVDRTWPVPLLRLSCYSGFSIDTRHGRAMISPHGAQVHTVSAHPGRRRKETGDVQDLWLPDEEEGNEEEGHQEEGCEEEGQEEVALPRAT